MKKLLFLIIISLPFVACRKDSTVYDGPSIYDSFGEFKLIETFKADTDSADFATGDNVVFTAKFNKSVKWTVTIVGQTTKSTKIIEGISNSLDAGNCKWNGSTSKFPVFKAENCKAYLTITDVTDTLETTVAIKSPKTIDGYVIADFETGLKPGWTSFIQTGADMDFGVKSDVFSPQGEKYLNMAGTVNWDWLIGLVDFPASAYGTAKTFPLSTNPDAVYFNCLVYGQPNTNSTLILFQFREDENGDGNFNANSDDQYDLQVNVDWEGWKLISIKYSDLTSLENGNPTIPKGNAAHNPDKLWKISMLHLANPNLGFASSKLDMIAFTTSKPLEP